MRAAKNSYRCGGVLLAALVACLCAGFADPEDAAPSTARCRDYIDRLTGEFQLKTAGDSPLTLARSEKSLLQWSWPRNGFTDGQTYVWAAKGRPNAIGSAFLIPGEQQAYYEFVSISTEPLICRHNDEVVWTPPAVDLAWWEVPNAPTLADAPRARLAQMRGIARQFHGLARMGPPRYEPGTRWELVLLTTPIYRYADADRGVLEGQIFVMAMGTDPQLLLILEAQGIDDKTAWKAACTRLSGFELEASFGEKTIWSSPKVENGHAKDSTWHLSNPLDASELFAAETSDGATE